MANTMETSDKTVLVYKIRDSLYLNLTNACTARCFFCPRETNPVVKGYNLKLDKDPTASQVIDAIDDPSLYKEVVFCGFGEPTLRIDNVIEIARWLKKNNVYVRMNTNGHGNLINGRSIAGELVGLVDEVCVSLNTIDPDEYIRIVRPKWGKGTFNEVINFIKECRDVKIKVVVTAVGIPELDEKVFVEFVEKKLGVTVRIRPFDKLGS